MANLRCLRDGNLGLSNKAAAASKRNIPQVKAALIDIVFNNCVYRNEWRSLRENPQKVSGVLCAVLQPEHAVLFGALKDGVSFVRYVLCQLWPPKGADPGFYGAVSLDGHL